MKKSIFIPVLAMIFAGAVPVFAGNVPFNGDEPKTQAADLASKASWMIILNFDNADSLNAAKSICDQAITLDPECVDAYVQRGDASFFLGQYDVALKDFDVAVQKRGNCDDYQYRGECKFNLEDLDGALADYKMAAQKGENDNASGANLAMGDANRLGIKLYNAEKYSEAVDAFTISVNATPTGNNIYNRANSEYLNGDKASALADWKTAGKLGNKDAKKSYKKFRKA
ncbi:MAG TPA: hypothetical protein VL651_06485 [Bacteroidia bacterium]|jgi:tetratricopeptide (TPR) repeat protein|nr:hypothetical protein [Bacteroidia bacterium]